MKQGWFDSHVHLDRLSRDLPLSSAVARARHAGVTGWLVPGVRRQHWSVLMNLVDQISGAWAAPGLHPMAAGQWSEATLSELDVLLAEPRVVAVGEIGLDGQLEIPLEVQENVFREQLSLAVAHRKPVMIHCRRAWGRVLEILRDSGAEQVGGILHAFGASLDIALQGWDLGFCCSFGGPLTYPNARKRIEVLQGLPAEAIVLETDAPDLPPHFHRGKENRPEWLPLIGKRVAELRGWGLEETARVTTENVQRILRIEGVDKE